MFYMFYAGRGDATSGETQWGWEWGGRININRLSLGSLVERLDNPGLVSEGGENERKESNPQWQIHGRQYHYKSAFGLAMTNLGAPTPTAKWSSPETWCTDKQMTLSQCNLQSQIWDDKSAFGLAMTNLGAPTLSPCNLQSQISNHKTKNVLPCMALQWQIFFPLPFYFPFILHGIWLICWLLACIPVFFLI